MFIIDYFLYKLYSFFVKYKNIYEKQASVWIYSVLFIFNLDTILYYCGINDNSDKWEQIILGIGLAVYISIAYFYAAKKRFEKIYEKYRNEKKIFNVLGWIAFFLYAIATFVFAYFKFI